MVEFHKHNDNTVSTKPAETDSNPLVSTKDWAAFNQTIAKNKPAASDNGIVEFNDPYKSDTKIAKPEAKSSNEDYIRYNKKLEAEKWNGKELEKKYVPNSVVGGGKFDGSKPDVPADGGIKKPYGIEDGIVKPNVPADGGIKKPYGIEDGIVKPEVPADGGPKDKFGKPNPAADGGPKDKIGKQNPVADGGPKDSVGKPDPAADGGLTDSQDKPEPAADGGLKDNHKAEGIKNGGEKQNFNPPAESAGRDNPAQTDRSDETYSIRDLSAQATSVRENFGNVTLASAQTLRQPWTVNGDGSVTRGTTRSTPVEK